jgi:hypothetical protein
MGTGAPREIEPAVLMASNLEKVKKAPTDVPAGQDDRCDNLHPGRFLGGAICGSGELFVRARELLGVEGATALNNYDKMSPAVEYRYGPPVSFNDHHSQVPTNY